MVNSVFCGIKCLSLLITPIVCDILFPILLTCEFHLRHLFIISRR